MKLTVSKSTLLKFFKLLKWAKIVAKLAAIGTTISGAVAALSGSATTGMALSAAGATTYAATRGLPIAGIEKTKHIPPGRVDKTANLLRQQQMRISKSARLKGGHTGVGSMKHAAIRTAMGTTTHLPRKK